MINPLTQSKNILINTYIILIVRNPQMTTMSQFSFEIKKKHSVDYVCGWIDGKHLVASAWIHCHLLNETTRHISVHRIWQNL